MVPVCVLPLSVDVIVAEVAVATAAVATVNLPVVAPVATETVAGSVADLEDEVSETETAPLPEPGIALRVTTPATLAPPMTDPGVRDRFVTWKGLRVMVVFWETPP